MGRARDLNYFIMRHTKVDVSYLQATSLNWAAKKQAELMESVVIEIDLILLIHQWFISLLLLFQYDKVLTRYIKCHLILLKVI